VKDEQNRKGKGTRDGQGEKPAGLSPDSGHAAAPEAISSEVESGAAKVANVTPTDPESTPVVAGASMASDEAGPQPAVHAPAASGKPGGKTTAGDSARPAGKASATAGPPPRGPVTADRAGGSGGKGLAGLALLIALAALGLSGWQWYQAQERDQPQDDPRLAQFEEQHAATRTSLDDLRLQLQDVPVSADLRQLRDLTLDLQRSQQALGHRLEALQGEAQVDWKLAEAEYMLRLASLRLLAAQDVRSAKELLRAVDDILREQPDTGVFAVRQQLAQAQAELDTLPEIDRSGIYLRLAALHEQVNRIVALPVPVFDPDEVSVEEEYEDRMARRTRAERVLMRLERYVRVDFQRGKVITPLLDEAEMQRIRRTLQLTLEQAQWAALRGEPEIYSSSLARADGMLQQFFELDNPQVRALQGQFALLAELQVALETPDLAPLQRSLNAYKQSLRDAAGAQVSGAAEGANDE
jgi:uroporphyrin-III C-methyltransferase